MGCLSFGAYRFFLFTVDDAHDREWSAWRFAATNWNRICLERRASHPPFVFLVSVAQQQSRGDMSFSACVSLGDHQLENQPEWGVEYLTAEEARVTADYLYEWAMAYYLPRQSGPLNWQEINAYAWRNVDGHGYCLDDDDQVFYWRGCPSAKIEKMLE